MAFAGDVVVRELADADGSRWRLEEPLSYAGRDDLFVVPAGFTTDFASVPRPFWDLEPPVGDVAKAAVVHDYLYVTKGLGGRYTRAQADGIFRKAMADLGVPLWKRTLLWAAVRIGGAGAWGS